MSILFQAGTISGLLQGIYEGDIDFNHLAKHGDIGLGTFNGVNGEMVAVDGVFYRIDAKGQAEIVKPDVCTPFSLVAHDKPTSSFFIETISNCNELNEKIDAALPTKNIFYMIRIDAEIEWIKLRSEGCQTISHAPLAELLPKIQHIFELSQLKGTLVTTRCPNYSVGITIPGFHHHFISSDKTQGGHVFDVKLKNAQVHVTPLRHFHLALTNSKEFDGAHLDIDTAELLKKTE